MTWKELRNRVEHEGIKDTTELEEGKIEVYNSKTSIIIKFSGYTLSRKESIEKAF